MKKILLFVLILLISASFLGCSPAANVGGDGKDIADTTPDEWKIEGDVLVVYFSCTNNTKRIAEYIAEAAKGDLYEIIPETPYTAADLDYNADCRANREQNDPSARPKISGTTDISRYGTVFIGYPIWWGKLPKIIYTFLDSHDLSGKTIIPFCTSGSSGISTSVSEIKKEEPMAGVFEGRRFSGNATKDSVSEWVSAFGLETAAGKTVKMYCGEKSLEIVLADNPSAKAFFAKLKEGDVTVEMDDYGNFEKVGELGFSLPRSDASITTAPGDVILYLGTKITVYYDVNNYNFTLLGRVADMTRETVLDFFGGKGNVEVTFSLK